MPLSGPRSGKFGIVQVGSPLAAATPMFNWTLIDDMAPEVYYASNTRGGAQRQAGVEDFQGSFNLYSGFPIVGALPILPGTKLSVELFTAPDTGIYGNPGTIYFGNIIVDSVSIAWQWQPTASLVTTVNFSAISCLQTKTGVIDDLSLLTPAKMCGLPLEYSIDDGQAWLPWDNVVNLSLNLTVGNQPIVNSSTACCTNRNAGNVDWGIVATEQECSEQFPKGTEDLRVKLYDTATTFWDIKWGFVRGYTNLTVNRQTGQIITRDLNIDMNAISGQEIGVITMPNTLIYWPPVPTTVTVGFGGVNEPPWKTVADV